MEHDKIKKAKEKIEGETVIYSKLWRRSDGKIELYLETSEDLEEIMKEQNGTIQESNSWNSPENIVNSEEEEEESGIRHKFYTRMRSEWDEDFYNIMSSYYDNYGGQFVKNGSFNVGVLRTVGINEGQFFEVNGRVSKESLIQGIQELKRIGKKLQKSFIKEIKLETAVTIEELE